MASASENCGSSHFCGRLVSQNMLWGLFHVVTSGETGVMAIFVDAWAAKIRCGADFVS